MNKTLPSAQTNLSNSRRWRNDNGACIDIDDRRRAQLDERRHIRLQLHQLDLHSAGVYRGEGTVCDRRTCRHLDGRLSDLQQVQPEAHQRDRKGRKQRTTRRISVKSAPKECSKGPERVGKVDKSGFENCSKPLLP